MALSANPFFQKNKSLKPRVGFILDITKFLKYGKVFWKSERKIETGVTTFSFYKQLKDVNIDDFNKTDFRLFLYILIHQTKDKGTVVLHYKTLEEKIGVKRTAIYDSIKKMQSKKIIAEMRGRGSCNRWYVNHMYMFKGNRLAFLEKENPTDIKKINTNLKTEHID